MEGKAMKYNVRKFAILVALVVTSSLSIFEVKAGHGGFHGGGGGFHGGGYHGGGYGGFHGGGYGYNRGFGGWGYGRDVGLGFATGAIIGAASSTPGVYVSSPVYDDYYGYY